MFRFKKIFFVFSIPVFLLFTIVQSGLAADVEFNYAEALQLSMYFYDANKCGPDAGDGRLEWRGDCHVKDVQRTYEDFSLPSSIISSYQDVFDPDGDGFIDVSGGFHDAGDHVKFGLPQSYSASTLGWGYYEFKEAFQETGQEDHILEILKAFSDYFLKCTYLDVNGDLIAFTYMVGEGTVDHSYWGPPELQYITDHDERPVDCAYPEEPASDQCAGASAALSLMYLNYQDINADYADECLEKAVALYDFAREYRGLGKGDGFYPSGGYYDELSWAAVWLYVATGDMTYIDHIDAVEDGRYVGYMSDIIETTENNWQNIWTHCWDAVWGGVFTKLATLFPENEQFDYFSRWNLEYWTGGQVPHEDPADTNFLEPTPAGYACRNTWGSARYNTAAQLLCLVYQKYNSDRTDLTDWARGQMEYIMGDNPMGYSYIVGYGDAYAEHPHHRAAHGSKTNSMEEPEEHRHILWGALVGGPDESDTHVDETSDYAYNEVAIDYNAAFVGALAGHYLLYGEGDEPLADFPPAEGEVQEFFTQARLEQENDERSQITITLTNDAVHPPRTEDGLSVRYFFNISELTAADQSIDDLTFDIYYDENAARYDGPVEVNDPTRWNDSDTYYIEIAWPGYNVYGEREVQIALMVSQDSSWESNWDPTNDFSREGITESDSMTPRIPVYIDGELVYGEEPPTSGAAPDAPELSATVYEDAKQVLLEWTAVDNAEGYQIIWSAEEGLSDDEIIDVGSTISYTIEDLTDNDTYTFEVQAYNQYGVSESSNVEKVVFGEPDITLGDLNGDSSINSVDYVLMRRYILGIINEFNYEYGEIAADMNEDAAINSLDYIFLQRSLLEI